MRPLPKLDAPVHDLIAKRWSPRAFADKPVEPEKLRSLFEAARWAASSGNEQPWRYIVAAKEIRAEYDRLLSVLVERNQLWAKSAPVLALSVSILERGSPAGGPTGSGKPNRHAMHDTGAASATLAIEAASLGLYIHQMGGFSVEKARELYAIPPNCEPCAAMAIGYLGDPATLPEDLRQREEAPPFRTPAGDLVFEGKWGSKASLFK